jgi:hypothetical protein
MLVITTGVYNSSVDHYVGIIFYIVQKFNPLENFMLDFFIQVTCMCDVLLESILYGKIRTDHVREALLVSLQSVLCD